MTSPRASARELKAATIAAAWQQMADHTEGSGCGDDLIFDYGTDGGMRNFFCRGLTYFSWKTFLALAPVKPFRAGPHKGSKLNLNSARDFGRYDPKFVQWAVDNLVPAANDSALRAATQPAYDSQVRALARTYAHAYRTITADPAWQKREADLYLRAADDPSQKPSTEATDIYYEVLGTDAQSWNGYDPNHVRSATMFWLRRTKDGTAPLFFDGLTKLLRTYDNAWLDTLVATKPGPLPQRPKANGKPEYR